MSNAAVEQPDAMTEEEREAFFARLRSEPTASASPVDMDERKALFESLMAAPHPETIQAVLDGRRPVVDADDGAQEQTPPLRVRPIYAERAPAKTVALAYPFTLDGLSVETVGLLPPPFADVEAVSEGTMAELDMIAGMAGLPVAALKAMRWPDIEAVTKAAQRLAPKVERR